PSPFLQNPTGQTQENQPITSPLPGPGQVGQIPNTLPARTDPATITNVYPGQDYADNQRDMQQQRQLIMRPTPTPTPEPDIEFQEFVGSALGNRLDIFGQNLFENVPSTFAPLDRVQVTPDYIIGPGDELIIRAWGQINVDFRAVVDRAGTI